MTYESFIKTFVTMLLVGGIAAVVCAIAWLREEKEIDRPTQFMLAVLLVALIGMAIVVLFPEAAWSRDVDGRYAAKDPKLHEWFEGLRSSAYGQCCADADGVYVDDPSWRVVSDPSRPSVHYAVVLEGRWLDVQDAQLVTVPNRVGRAMLWPMHQDGGASIRCFMPGGMG